MRIRTAIGAAILTGTLALPGQTLASELAQTENEATYLRYHTAIRAAERCNRVEFTQEQHSAMAKYISGLIDHDIGTKRLRLIGEAKRQAEDMTSGGCANAKAREMMELYDAELAPLIR